MRRIIEQVALGLRAMHRKEIVHQDLRPENILIDQSGSAKIIDFGATRIAGVSEATPMHSREGREGALQNAAPEYFVGELGTHSADYFSLGVIAYQMLTGGLPYGTQVSKLRALSQLRRLKYISAQKGGPSKPAFALCGTIRIHHRPADAQRHLQGKRPFGRAKSACLLERHIRIALSHRGLFENSAIHIIRISFAGMAML